MLLKLRCLLLFHLEMSGGQKRVASVFFVSLFFGFFFSFSRQQNDLNSFTDTKDGFIFVWRFYEYFKQVKCHDELNQNTKIYE